MSGLPSDWLLELGACDRPDLAGGKAVNLCRLLRAGFPVPGGFAITTAAFRGGRSGGAMAPELAAEVRRAYARLGEPPVAVRSSATAEDLLDASMAGQYETILDVRGGDALVAAVERCWASLDTPRTRSYLAERGIPIEAVAMAVVVQRLVPAEVAGVLFTANVRNGRRDQMLIEASWGLGESVVSGSVQPDTLVLNRADGVVVEAVIADKPVRLAAGAGEQAVDGAQRRAACLDAVQVEALRRLGERVAAHFASPQDLEWAWAGGELFLLQSRAITTLDDAEARAAAQTAVADFLPANPGRGPWVAHNLGETLPQPTPLTWSLVRRFMSGAGGFGELYRMAGFAPGVAACRDGVLDLIGGRIYLDCSRAPGMFWEGYPFRYDPAALAAAPDAGQNPPDVPCGTPAEMREASRRLTDIGARLDALAPDAAAVFREREAPAFRAWVATEAAVDLSALDRAALLARLDERAARTLDGFAPQSLLPGFVLGHVLQQIAAEVAMHDWDHDAVAVARDLASGGQPDATLRANAGLHALAGGRMTLEEWLAEHGHRGPGEFELAAPRWREVPERVRALAAALATGADPLAQHAAQAERAAALLEEVCGRCPPAAAARIRRLVAIARACAPLREDGKHELMRGWALVRAASLALGTRLGIGEDVVLLSRDELGAAVATGYAPLALIAQRRRQRRAEAGLAPPPLLPAPPSAPTPSAAGSWRAFAISPGAAAGPVRKVLDPARPGELGTGYVLVCRSTDPSWTPLFVNAAALVLERGGSLSHGAVVARELGKPAVVLPDALAVLPDGAQVRIDGDRGVIALADAVAPAAPAADDGRLRPVEIPPPVSPRERAIGCWSLLATLMWSVPVAAYFLAPSHLVAAPVLSALDAVLWPLVPLLGPVGTVAAVAAALAVALMLLQLAVSDTPRLREAKRRMQAAQRLAAALPADSPRRTALLRVAGPVQWRITLAALHPVGLVFGPLILAFMWFPERIDPAARPKPAGAAVTVTAVIAGSAAGPATLELPAGSGLSFAPGSPAEAALIDVRAALTGLRDELAAPGHGEDALPWQLRGLAADRRDALVAGLSERLARPMPEQTVQWRLASAPTAEGRHRVTVRCGDDRLDAWIVLGEGQRPDSALREGRGAVRSLATAYRGARAQDDAVPPFVSIAGFGLGWLWVYLLVYLPVMLVAKRLLRIP